MKHFSVRSCIGGQPVVRDPRQSVKDRIVVFRVCTCEHRSRNVSISISISMLVSGRFANYKVKELKRDKRFSSFSAIIKPRNPNLYTLICILT